MMYVNWIQGNYSVQRGSAGDVELFTLSRSTRRDCTDWHLMTRLPGVKEHYAVATEQIGKATAEKVFRTFITRVGGTLS